MVPSRDFLLQGEPSGPTLLRTCAPFFIIFENEHHRFVIIWLHLKRYLLLFDFERVLVGGKGGRVERERMLSIPDQEDDSDVQDNDVEDGDEADPADDEGGFKGVL